METPQISRSGRVLKKSAKVKEMEDFDINELDMQGKVRKKPRLLEDYEEFDDKRVAPIKIPKISLGVPGGSKKKVDVTSPIGRLLKPTFHPTTAMKVKQDARCSIYNDSSDGSKESDSSSVSSESSSSTPSSSEPSDDEEPYAEFKTERKHNASLLQQIPIHHEKVIVEQHQQRFESPVYLGHSSEPSSDESEDAESDSALVIAEDSDESLTTPPRGQKVVLKRGIGKKDPSYAPKQAGPGGRKKPVKAVDTLAARKKKPVAKGKPLSAYMLWCSENRKKIAATTGNIGFGNIGKKMGETWQALPEKEKMAWRRKAKRLAGKTTGNVMNTGSNNVQIKSINRNAANMNDELLKGLNLNEPTGVLGTAPIDAAAHLKLLGDSLTVIGQRLIEHEGQLAVSGIYSVLLDTLLCAIGPLLCLTSEIAGLENLPQDVFKKTLDHIAYFMPGL